MALMFAKPKSVPLPGCESGFLVEPTVGTISTFVSKLNEFPKIKEDQIDARYFAGLRALICLYSRNSQGDLVPFVTELANSLNDCNSNEWMFRYSETDTVSQVLDAFDVTDMMKLIDHFLNQITASQMEEINILIKTKVWVDKVPDEKN